MERSPEQGLFSFCKGCEHMSEVKNFKPNSHAYKESMKVNDGSDDKKKEIERMKITGGTSTTTKPTFMKKVTKTFMTEDISNVKSYVISDVIVPGIKDFVWDVLISTINSMFGKTGVRKNYSKESWRTGYDKVKHSSGYSDREEPKSLAVDWEDIDFGSRGDAEYVLDSMQELISKYENVSILEYCGLADREGKYTWDKYGWTNLSTAKVIKSWDGRFKIRFPKPELLDDK